jgi:hypothetical protein
VRRSRTDAARLDAVAAEEALAAAMGPPPNVAEVERLTAAAVRARWHLSILAP